MPSTLFADMDGSTVAVSSAASGTVSNGSTSLVSTGGVVEDQRALQIALEQFSMLNIGGSAENRHSMGSRDSGGQSASNSHSSSPPLGVPASNGGHVMMLNNADLINGSLSMADNMYQQCQDPTKRSQNMTECVPVPSSEHVAEIVGRQGCKIKALRAKTNTYIKTPVRGEEPVFVVTGRREDVTAAKREILSAAEHFSQIRAQRKNQTGPPGGGGGGGSPGLGGANGQMGGGNGSGFVPCPPNAGMPGQLTIQVRVPYRVVGLVVGPKGATIKRIQQQTNTYIITPSRDKEPIFEVTGAQDNVEVARREIEMHIAIRTGGIVDTNTGETCNDFTSNGIDTWNNDDAISNIGVWKAPNENGGQGGRNPGGGDAGGGMYGNKPMYKMNDMTMTNSQYMTNAGTTAPPESTFTTTGSFGVWGESAPDEGISSPGAFDMHGNSLAGAHAAGQQTHHPNANNMWPTFTDDTSFFNANKAIMPPQRSFSLGAGGNSPSMADNPGAMQLNAMMSEMDANQMHVPARRMRSDPLGMAPGAPAPAPVPQAAGPFSNGMPNFITAGPFGASLASSPTDSTGSAALQQRRNSKECILCSRGPIVAALVPCGHNLFCMECASRLTSGSEANMCPICNCKISQAIRIFST